MFINTTHKYCWTSCPRTGTLSMHIMLKHIPGTKAIGMFHSTTIPGEYKDYFRFMVVRNPYRRLLSWWWWWMPMRKDSRTISERGKYTAKDFKTFLRWICENHDKCTHEHTGYQWENQATFAKVFRPNQILKLETLAEDIQTLPFWTPELKLKNALGHKAKGDRKPWQEYFGPEEIALAHKHSQEDFDTFGYEQL